MLRRLRPQPAGPARTATGQPVTLACLQVLGRPRKYARLSAARPRSIQMRSHSATCPRLPRTGYAEPRCGRLRTIPSAIDYQNATADGPAYRGDAPV
jgi:hypothetical protein